jgi:MoxR-like ATPase
MTLDIDSTQFGRAEFARMFNRAKAGLIELDRVVALVLLAYLSGHHPRRPRPNGVLLEGLNGLAKTQLCKQTAHALAGPQLRSWFARSGRDAFLRINGNPDLAREDLVGSDVLGHARNMVYVERGLINPSIVALFDEINRTPPRSQALMLQAMAEREVKLETLDPRYEGRQQRSLWWLFVVATMNPTLQEGTYALPEAQIDRFLGFVQMPYPRDLEAMLKLDDSTAAASSEPDPSLEVALAGDGPDGFGAVYHDLFQRPAPTAAEVGTLADRIKADGQVQDSADAPNGSTELRPSKDKPGGAAANDGDGKPSDRQRQARRAELALIRQRINELNVWRDEVNAVRVPDDVASYIARYVFATWPEDAAARLAPSIRPEVFRDPAVQRLVGGVQQGVMPRGAQALRDLARALCWAETASFDPTHPPAVTLDHVDRVAPYTLTHRITLRMGGLGGGPSPLAIVEGIRDWLRGQRGAGRRGGLLQ